jgi:hypothetical protein
MKRIPLAVFVMALALPWTAHSQPRPDFSGIWRMDPARSESALQGEPIGEVTLVITQTAGELKIETTRGQRTTAEIYKLDGTESRVTAGTAKARWDGDALVTETVRDIQGASVTTKESRRLNPAGTEMIVDAILEVQHGYSLKGAKNYGTGKDVFTRVRP